jgi:uncharacterized membrane protein YhiD involved in acid resistance
MVSAIGLAVGAGLYTAGIWSFAITLFALFVLRAVEGRMSRMSFMSLSITSSEGLTEERITEALTKYGAYAHNIEYEKDMATGEISYRMTLGLRYRVSHKGIFDALASLEDVRKVSLRRS